ncbi:MULTISPECIES: nucleotidyl transferase AbiEii/AbiGii toxin family protein [Sinorhizobium]|uniref:nucleotidyl transferase AbiEii/AbiGii toxin family protein n=1 Tax=Sinorhizobium TaxID=28105 RepID=UPI0004245CE7|nr:MULTISPECIES: nucleotidyl transferase AbiEii/AbiGii toxin family protein [Sinorhizobium]WOS67073.1 nucleotidyl transferase AbiEii/AbiGii toxin family protein [Sinorhizobium fredii GR64]
MARDQYMRQVDLLVRTLPFIARHEAFALKGGTAINLFYRDMPRLSVDIDLTYLPIEDRESTLKNIDTTLEHIREDLMRNLRGVNVQRIAGGGNNDTRVLVRQGNAEIKIETSPVARGTVHPPERRRVSESVEEAFGFAEVQVVSFEDLFGGKLHAAVDRQHPRDLFDVKLLYENEGLTDALFRTFLIYVAGSGRPPHELVRPSLADLDEAFVKEFQGMTIEPVSLDDLKAARAQMTADILAKLDQRAMRFLLSLHDGEPDFAAIGLPQAAELPAVRWKLLNLRKLKEQNPTKHAEQRHEIEDIVSKTHRDSGGGNI